ncbi:MAG: WG repeat-containing protein [Saprospiraceae bacterium]|nr:WG repeat-containing protein [Saprospiraceae bacterium]
MTFKHIALMILVFAVIPAAQAQRRKTDPNTHKKGFYDRQGKTLIPFEYDELPSDWDSIMVAQKGSYRGLINGHGKVILPFEYQQIRLHLKRGGFSLVKKKTSTWGIVNARGEFILPMRFESVAVIDQNLLSGRAAGETEVQLYDGKGVPLYKLPGKTVEPGFDSNSLKILGHDNRSRYTDRQGRPIFPAAMPNARWTDGDVIISGSYDDYGLLNFKGDTILPLKYRSVQPALPGQFMVSTTDYKHGVVDKKGRPIVPLGTWQVFRHEKYYRVEDVAHKSGLYAPDGQVILPMEYNIREPGVYNPYKDDPDAQPQRYLLIGNPQAPYLKGLYSASDASVILPIEYKEIWYRSENQPLFASKEPAWPAKREVMAFDLTGKPILASPFAVLSHTSNPRILLASRGGDGLFGFLHLDGDTAQTAFELRHVNELRPGIYMALKDSLAVMLTPEGKQLYQGKLDGATKPYDWQKQIFEKMPNATGELLVVAPKPGGGWIGVNNEGKEFYLPDAAAPPMTAPVVPDHQPNPPSSIAEEVQQPANNNFPVTKKATEVPKNQVDEEGVAILTIEVPPIKEEIWEAEQVDTPPQFPGGPDSAAVFFPKRLQPCEVMRQTKDERYGHTKLEIVGREDGSFSNIRSWSPFGNNCNRDVERVAGQMPRWVPAKKDGRAVHCRCFLVVKHRAE